MILFAIVEEQVSREQLCGVHLSWNRFNPNDWVYSLSRREESSKNKLFVCLLVCPHFIDRPEKDVRTEEIIFHKTSPNVIFHPESK
jgi:hypothetical protein